nr:hypothetical protein [Propionibacterium sp.]
MRLMDALVAPSPRAELPPRLKALHFPAPLEWIRIEDVIREARAEEPSLSAKAFWNRWADKDSFVVDLVTYALDTSAMGGTIAPHTHRLRDDLSADRPSVAIRILTRSVMLELLAQPQAFLLGHLAAVVHHAPSLQEALARGVDADARTWEQFYDATLAAAGLRWRPGWDAARAQVVLGALIDGLLVRSRVQLPDADRPAWDPADLLADATIAIFAGMVDVDRAGRSPAEVLDAAAAGDG